MPALNERLKEARTELFNLRFQAATGQLENHRQIRNVRRQIAQVLTVMQGRSLGFEQVLAAPQAGVPVKPASRGGEAPAVTPARAKRKGKARADAEGAVAEPVEASAAQVDVAQETEPVDVQESPASGEPES
jgi:large subunit ribosomal protein L29